MVVYFKPNGNTNSLHINIHFLQLTFLPALLLCRFIRLLSSPSNSLASRNRLANLIPYPMSTLHPPHFHPEGAVASLGPLGSGAQPQEEMLPRAHAAVTAYATPALDIAYVNAASLEPDKEHQIIFSFISYSVDGSNLYIIKNYWLL